MDNKAISVSELNNFVYTIIDNLPQVKNILVCGEISNFKHNSSGHLYFTLKDEQSQVPCVMFKYAAQSLKFEPKDGDSVYVKCSLTVYPQGGRYQLQVTGMEEAGLGDLYKRFEELKKKLELKGYFDESRKRKFPEYPKCIALLTSKTGAVIEDLKSIILKRSQFSNLILYPTKVQGEEAKYDIVRNIERANDNPLVDCIILARGGGSIEDLWPFNEEIVADAIYNSKKPLMSAVGHETDFTISDFVSDKRAATPSDAALMIVKDSKDLESYLNQITLRLKHSFSNYYNNYSQTLDNLVSRLNKSSPKALLERSKENINNLTKTLDSAYKLILEKNKNSHQVLNEKLMLLNPLSIIDKGYSVTFKNNEIVKSIKEVEPGDLIETKVKDGSIKSKVI